MPVRFDVSKEDAEMIGHIVNRARATVPSIDKMALGMDLTAAHANGCPLDLEKFYMFGDADFFHDIVGISNNLDRNTGKVLNCFLPRCGK
jgi:hypothetical protein